MCDLTRVFLVSVALLVCLHGSAQAVIPPSEQDPTTVRKCLPGAQRIAEEKFVAIGGIEQWVTISGSNCANPVILFLHGGPGNPLSPYARGIYGAWENDFTLAQWDQRGAGKTYGQDPRAGESELAIERMTKDGIELATYLIGYLNTEKIILIGGSWGSVLGIHMAKSRPDLFHAYVGTGQLVSYRDNVDASYQKLLAMARADGDTRTATELEALGRPPWVNPRSFGILRRATRIYEAKTATTGPKSWWVPSPLYATPRVQADYENGEEYSYIQFVDIKGKGMFSAVDLPSLGATFEIPIFLLQGSEDLVTVPEVAKRYFDTIVAPRKEYVLLPRTGHDPNLATIDAQLSILKTVITPLVRKTSLKPPDRQDGLAR